mmetsp:Transcript_130278/g.230215  ORF Transcript_130278/g.230215 Transcript_130278/m.230215 type:complete len:258 (+) Transcript_130278:1896-2669(+)
MTTQRTARGDTMPCPHSAPRVHLFTKYKNWSAPRSLACKRKLRFARLRPCSPHWRSPSRQRSAKSWGFRRLSRSRQVGAREPKRRVVENLRMASAVVVGEMRRRSRQMQRRSRGPKWEMRQQTIPVLNGREAGARAIGMRAVGPTGSGMLILGGKRMHRAKAKNQRVGVHEKVILVAGAGEAAASVASVATTVMTRTSDGRQRKRLGRTDARRMERVQQKDRQLQSLIRLESKALCARPWAIAGRQATPTAIACGRC